MGKTGILLVNLGTPDSTKVSDVRKYLREFLSDGRVIDIPALPRLLLVNGIIAPFRAPSSAKEYRKLWTERGSPLLYHGLDLQEKVQELMGTDYIVEFGMRYQSPALDDALERLRAASVSSILVVPLFPQYASATTGSVHQKVMELAKQWQVVPEIRLLSNFVDHPAFVEAWVKRGKAALAKDDYEHVVFSYHGIPERQIRKGSQDGYCKLGSCCNHYGPKNRYCYRAQCFLTTRLVAEGLGLQEGSYSTTFQSRLGRDPWLQPYTDKEVVKMAEGGMKKVLAFSPAFVADCLETTIEVGEEFAEEFEEAGGEKLTLVPSLNADQDWAEGLTQIIKDALPEKKLT